MLLDIKLVVIIEVIDVIFNFIKNRLVNLLSRHSPVLLEFKARLRLLHPHDTCFVPDSRWIHYIVNYYRKNKPIPTNNRFSCTKAGYFFFLEHGGELRIFVLG